MNIQQAALEMATLGYAAMFGKEIREEDPAYVALVSYAAISEITVDEARDNIIREFRNRRSYYAQMLLTSFAQNLATSVIHASNESQSVEWGLKWIPLPIMDAVATAASTYALVAGISGDEALRQLRSAINTIYVNRHNQ